MELLEKLDILSSKIDALNDSLKREQGRSALLEAENSQLKDELAALREQRDAVRERIEKLIAKL